MKMYKILTGDGRDLPGGWESGAGMVTVAPVWTGARPGHAMGPTLSSGWH